MDIKLISKYKQYDIEYVEHLDSFRAMRDGEFESINKTLKGLKMYLDNKMRNSFKKVDGIIWESNTLHNVLITGVNSRGDKWITFKNEITSTPFSNKAKRKLVNIVYLDTQQNRDTFVKLDEYRQEIEKLETLRNRISNGLKEYE